MTLDRTRLVVRRVIPAPRERLFAAWIEPDQLLAWWGPRGVRCTRADVDARPGGQYRIDNALPDGTIVTITGEFVTVDPPSALVFTWRTAPGAPDELVTVELVPHADGTEIVVTHEKIPDARARDDHATGWDGCLAGLAAWLAA